MFKKKIFGIFGKDADDKPSVPQIPEQPLISEEKISCEEGEHEDSESIENPEDIISKLAQINNIIGDEEEIDDEEDHDISHFFGDDDDDDEGFEVEDEEYEAPPTEDVDAIQVPAESILASIPAEALAASANDLNAEYAGNSDYRFNLGKEDVSYGLSVGKVEVAFSDLVNKIPINIFSDAADSFYDQKIDIDLVSILPLVPPAWFAIGDQDASQEEMVSEMEDLFPSLSLPKPAEAEEETGGEEDIGITEQEEISLVEEAEEISAVEELASEAESDHVDLAAETTNTSLQEIAEAESFAEGDLAVESADEIAIEQPLHVEAPTVDLDEPHSALSESLDKSPMQENPVDIDLDEADLESDVQSIPLSPSIQNEHLKVTPEISEPVPLNDAASAAEIPKISLQPSESVAESDMQSIPLSAAVQNEESESIRQAEEQVLTNNIEPEAESPKLSLKRPDPIEEEPVLEISQQEHADDIVAPAAPSSTLESVGSGSGLSLKQPEPVLDEVISLDDVPEMAPKLPDTPAGPLSMPEPVAAEVDAPMQSPLDEPTEKPPAPVLKPPATLEMSAADGPDASPEDASPLEQDETEISEDVETVEEVVSGADADADDVQNAANELLVGDKPHESLNISEKSVSSGIIKSEERPVWKSRAPNGIDINRSGIEELCLLASVGEHLAQSIIDHRTKRGKFGQLQDLLNIPGLGNYTYRKMTRLSAKTEIADAELHVNKNLEIDGDIVSLNQVVKTILTGQQLNAIFISSVDGLILAKSTADVEYAKLSESLAAVAPQLYKRAKKALNQGRLPAADMYTFYIGKNAVTFAGSDQLFVVFIHNTDYPNQQQLKKCRKITQELVWYCSYRAVIS